MTISVNTGLGQVTLTSELKHANGSIRHVPHMDVLNAFNKCHFKSPQEVEGWLKRFNDARRGISRSFLAREMVKSHQYSA